MSPTARPRAATRRTISGQRIDLVATRTGLFRQSRSTLRSRASRSTSAAGRGSSARAAPLPFIVLLRARVGAALPLARLHLARSRVSPRLRSRSSCCFALASARRSHSLGCTSLEVACLRASARAHRVASRSRRRGAPTRSAAPRSKSRVSAPPLALIVLLRARVGAALPLARLHPARSRVSPRLRSRSRRRHPRQLLAELRRGLVHGLDALDDLDLEAAQARRAVVDAIDAAADVLLPAAEARRLLRDPPDDVPQRPAALQLLARHARDALRRVDERLRRVGQAAAVEALLRDGPRHARPPLPQPARA